MNSTPTLTEQPALTRADIYKGLTSAYYLVRKMAWQGFCPPEDRNACLRVLKHIEEAMEDHWAKGTAFERGKQ